jgi:protein SCO1/2
MRSNGTLKLTGLAKVFAFVAVVLCLQFYVNGQKSEHYNSPLYSPKYYDPSVNVSNGLPKALKEVGIEQRLGEQLPLDAVFALVYYECPMLCNQVLNGLTGTLKGISLEPGKDFDVIAVSFDSRENEKAGLAANKKASYMERFNRKGTEGGFHFLTGDQASVDAITRAVGFNYQWDEKSNQFAHASAIMVITPEGKLSRYFYGIDYSPKDVKFGLMESADKKIGGVSDQLLLYCYHYDPSTGKYGFQILSALRLTAIATLLGMGAMGFVFWRRNKVKE